MRCRASWCLRHDVYVFHVPPVVVYSYVIVVLRLQGGYVVCEYMHAIPFRHSKKARVPIPVPVPLGSSFIKFQLHPVAVTLSGPVSSFCSSFRRFQIQFHPVPIRVPVLVSVPVPSSSSCSSSSRSISKRSLHCHVWCQRCCIFRNSECYANPISPLKSS